MDAVRCQGRRHPIGGAALAAYAAAAAVAAPGPAAASGAASSPAAAPRPEPPHGLRPEWRAVFERFPDGEYRDIECDHVRGGYIQWSEVREQAALLDQRWRDSDFPAAVCEEIRVNIRTSESGLVVARPQRAFAECALGSLTAVLLPLICAGACLATAAALSEPLGSRVAEAFEWIWRETLAGPGALPAYMLGTSSWPVGALLAKWQTHCRAAGSPAGPPPLPQLPPVCHMPEVDAFTGVVERKAQQTLLPILLRQGQVNVELVLGEFARVMIPALANFMNSAPFAEPSFSEECISTAATQGTMLVLLRLLGPPANSLDTDPLHGERLAELGQQLSKLSLAELVFRTPFAIGSVLAASCWLTYRSHRLYGGGADVPLAEVRRVLDMAAVALREADEPHPQELPGRYGSGLLESLHDDRLARLRLWGQVAVASEQGSLGPLWGQLCRWLLLGEPPASSLDAGDAAIITAAGAWPGPATPGAAPTQPAFFTMAFGNIPEQWLRHFFQRALDVGIARLIFVSPTREIVQVCEDVAIEENAEARLLCIRVFVPFFSRIYDFNNKAKFYLFPIMLALGVDVIWLDLDIFLFKNPARRMLRQSYELDALPKDVIVTDHFDEHCLNHGVFLVRASDRSLLWLLEYIRWMHWYPYGHDQNGWDAFLVHSIQEPQTPKDLRQNPAINVSYGLLNTELEYVTLTGWAGDVRVQRSSALLLHCTTTKGITERMKKNKLMELFNATGRTKLDSAADQHRVDMVAWKALRRLETSWPMVKNPCYEGIHVVVGQLLQTGLYQDLLA